MYIFCLIVCCQLSLSLSSASTQSLVSPSSTFPSLSPPSSSSSRLPPPSSSSYGSQSARTLRDSHIPSLLPPAVSPGTRYRGGVQKKKKVKKKINDSENSIAAGVVTALVEQMKAEMIDMFSTQQQQQEKQGNVTYAELRGML